MRLFSVAPVPTPVTPKLCRHHAQNQGYVTLNGREFYLGHWPVSRGKKPPAHVQTTYDDLIANWLTNNRQLPHERPPVTVNEVLLAYVKWAEQHYVPRVKKNDQILGHSKLTRNEVYAEIDQAKAAAVVAKVG